MPMVSDASHVLSPPVYARPHLHIPCPYVFFHPFAPVAERAVAQEDPNYHTDDGGAANASYTLRASPVTTMAQHLGALFQGEPCVACRTRSSCWKSALSRLLL